MSDAAAPANSASPAEKLIRSHDGAMALLYIYIVYNGSFDREKAAEDLCMTISEISSAEEKLIRAGLISRQGEPNVNSVQHKSIFGNTKKKESQEMISDQENNQASENNRAQGRASSSHVELKFPEQDPPQYTSEDVIRIAETDPAFEAILQEARSVLGQDLSSNDMKRLCSFYHYLGLPADTMFVLLHYCFEISSENSRKLSMNFIEKNAFFWANKGIFSVDQAEEYCEKQRSIRSSVGKIKKVLDIYDRKLTASEEKYILSWIDMGFAEDVVYEAYDRTMIKTGKRSFAYIDSILSNWDQKNAHTVSEIKILEDAFTAAKTTSKSPSGNHRKAKDEQVNIKDIEKIMNRIKGN